MSSWLTSTKAIPARRLKKRPPCMASNWNCKAYRSQTGLPIAATQMGRGKKLRMGRPLSPPGTRLQKTRNYARSLPLPRLRLPHDRQPFQVARVKLITGSSARLRGNQNQKSLPRDRFSSPRIDCYCIRIAALPQWVHVIVKVC